VIAKELQTLIHLLGKLPGMGPRSGRKVALHLMKAPEKHMRPLTQALDTALEKVAICKVCGNLDTCQPCTICDDAKRDTTCLCVVAEVADIWALERSPIFRGKYHVLGGVLSALDGMTPDKLNISTLLDRLHQDPVEEVVLALSATVEGQTTVHYLMEHLARFGCRVSTLAHGVPMGGELDYLDEGTLSTALQGRKVL